jgi:hypothetical protein
MIRSATINEKAACTILDGLLNRLMKAKEKLVTLDNDLETKIKILFALRHTLQTFVYENENIMSRHSNSSNNGMANFYQRYMNQHKKSMKIEDLLFKDVTSNLQPLFGSSNTSSYQKPDFSFLPPRLSHDLPPLKSFDMKQDENKFGTIINI